MASGLIRDQAQPSTERLYFDRRSRSVRLVNSSPDERYVAILVNRYTNWLGPEPETAARE